MRFGLRDMRWNTAVQCWWFAYALIVALCCMAAMYTLAVSQWRGPWRDMWEVMPFLEKAMHGTASWSDYWEQYGFSHRPLISRWLWVADLKWFAGSNLLLLVVSFAMQLLIFFSVRSVLQRDISFSAQQRSIVLVGVVFCLLNITQVFNFMYTFDVQWFLVTGSIVLSLSFILQSSSVSSQSLFAAWVLVFFASLNNFSGLVVWPIEILLLICLRVSWQKIGIFTLAFIAYLFVYFYRLMPEEGGGPVSVLAQASWKQLMLFCGLTLIKFPLWYLSNPLSFQLSTEGPLHAPVWVSWLAPSLVLVLLMASIRMWCRSLLYGTKFSAVAWLGLSLMLFGYGVSAVTAVGRIFFWDNVYALRYQNIVLLFWIGVVLWLSASVRWRNARLVVGSLLLLLIYLPNIGWYHEAMLKTGNRTRDAHLALVVGLEKHLSAIQATVSRSHLGKDSKYTLEKEAGYLRILHVGPYAESAWNNIPLLTELSTSSACQTPVAERDVRGSDDSYARLSLRFREPVSYNSVVWYDNSTTPFGLLIPVAADTWWARLKQSRSGFAEYAGFSKQLPKQQPRDVFARAGQQWCRLVFLQ